MQHRQKTNGCPGRGHDMVQVILLTISNYLGALFVQYGRTVGGLLGLVGSGLQQGRRCGGNCLQIF